MWNLGQNCGKSAAKIISMMSTHVGFPESSVQGGTSAWIAHSRSFRLWKDLLTRWAIPAFLLGLSACIVLGTEIRQPVAEVNVAEASAPFRVALQRMRGFPANVRLSFLGEDRLAISSMDDAYAPSYGHVAMTTFHLTIDVFTLKAATLKATNQLRFDTQMRALRLFPPVG